jgi:hypothetical protein
MIDFSRERNKLMKTPIVAMVRNSIRAKVIAVALLATGIA